MLVFWSAMANSYSAEAHVKHIVHIGGVGSVGGSGGGDDGSDCLWMSVITCSTLCLSFCRNSSHKYEGEFKDGRFDGFGVFTRSDGMMYEGEFHDGNITGSG